MSISGLKLRVSHARSAPAKESPHRTKYRRHLVRYRASINGLGQLLIDPPPADNRPCPSVLPTTGMIPYPKIFIFPNVSPGREVIANH